jgi:hypothetical protein
MSQEQTVKITGNGDVFFFDYNFKTGYEHSENYIKRNKGKFIMKVYYKNRGGTGNLWTHIKTIGV